MFLSRPYALCGVEAFFGQLIRSEVRVSLDWMLGLFRGMVCFLVRAGVKTDVFGGFLARRVEETESVDVVVAFVLQQLLAQVVMFGARVGSRKLIRN